MIKQVALYGKEYLLSYATYGHETGQPILVQHGMIASIRDGDLFHCLVEAGRYVVCVARPGYGASSPYGMRNLGEWGEVVAGLVDALKLAQFDVLGMSSGAPYSYALGHKFPDRVQNIYIFSGIPALYNPKVAAHWPFPVTQDASLADMEKVAHDVFFSNLSAADLERNDIKDSMMHNGFGLAQDLQLRGRDWGFGLAEVQPHVYMRHSRGDGAVPFITAELTARLLPHCTLEVQDGDVHFSPEALDEFIQTTLLASSPTRPPSPL